MSYILEALKKSDKKRQREEIPGLESDHSFSSGHRREYQAPGWYLPVTVILIALSFGGLFLWKLYSNERPYTGAPQSLPSVSSPPASSSLAKARSTVQKATPNTAAEPSSVVTKYFSEEVTPAATVLPKNVPATVATKNDVGVKKAPVQSTVQPEKVVPPLIEELPVEITDGLPELTFAGHAYSVEAGKRLIIINNRIVREGDLISSGLSLKKITPNGVVLRYEATVFRVDLF